MRVTDQVSTSFPSGVVHEELQVPAGSMRLLITRSRQTGGYAVSSFSHLYSAVNQNHLTELYSDINTPVFSVSILFQ